MNATFKNLMHHQLLRYSIIVGSLTMGHIALSAPSAATSEATVAAQLVEDGKILKVSLTTPAETELNFLGPWKLKIDPQALSLADGKNEFSKEDFDQTSKSFSLPIAKVDPKKSGDRYELTYFLCDEEKTWCKRIQAKGEIKVK